MCVRTNWKILFAALFIVLAVSTWAAEAPGVPQKRTFNTRDSIEMMRFAYEPLSEAPICKVAPDGSKVILVLRKGNLSTGNEEYTIRLYDVDEILSYVREKGRDTLPRGDAIVHFNTPSIHPGISDIEWSPDSTSFAFIGRDEAKVGQVYIYHLLTRTLARITRHATNIVSFAIAWEKQRVVFSSVAPPDWQDRDRRGYIIEPLEQVDIGNFEHCEAELQILQRFVQDLGQHTERELLGGQVSFASVADHLEVSPDGKWLLAARSLTRVPRTWAKYTYDETKTKLLDELLKYDVLTGGSASEYLENLPYVTLEAFQLFSQYILIDLETGTSHFPLDAPAGWLGAGGVFWSSDSRKILFRRTYIPFSGDRCEVVPAVLEYDLQTRAYAQIKVIPKTDVIQRWDGNRIFAKRSSGGGNRHTIQFEREGDSWRERASSDEVASMSDPQAARVRFRVIDGLDIPPELAARDLATGKERTITALNPQLKEIDLGHVEQVEWADRLNRKFICGLVLPPGYREGVRYPVVIQSHSFRPGHFLVDGPGVNGGGPYAARALAARGIVVLQAQGFDSPGNAQLTGAYEQRGPVPLFTIAVEDAIDMLDKRGIVDRARVGLIGFSALGMATFNATAFAKTPIAAAVVSDSYANTPFGFSLQFGSPGIFSGFEDDDHLGGQFWGGAKQLWYKRSVLFNLERIRAAIRFESNGTGLPSFWDCYTILARHLHPVEMSVLPYAGHTPDTPFGNFTSQEGNVDWLSFWLLGYEDPSRDKSAQYSRWKRLRAVFRALEDPELLRTKPRDG